MTETKTTPAKKKPAAARRRRKNDGVPVALVAMLLVITLFFGGLLGFVIANKTSDAVQALAAAKEQIAQLENTLTMMGFSEEKANPDAWVFDDTGTMDEMGDLSGAFSSDNSDILWSDNSLLAGMMELSGEPVVVAEFEGGELMSDEVIEPYNDMLATQAFGFFDTTASTGDTLSTVLETLVTDKICYAKAEQMGLTELTDADLAKITADAEADLAEQLMFYAAYVETEGMSEAEAAAAVETFLATEAGVTLEGLIETRKADYWTEKLYAEITKDVTVSDEELQAAYDSLLAEQKAQFTEYPLDYEFAIMSGMPIAYNLEGYRRVKHILLAFDDVAVAEQAMQLTDEIAALDPATELEKIGSLQEQLKALYTDLDAQAEAILGELNGGADFDALIEKYGMDEGMDYEPTKSLGYSVSAASTAQFSTDFVEASMILEEVGSVSTPVHSVAGVHIIKYVGDVTPGEVPMADIAEALTAELLIDKQDAHYVEQVAQWISEANVRYYPERLQ